MNSRWCLSATPCLALGSKIHSRLPGYPVSRGLTCPEPTVLLMGPCLAYWGKKSLRAKVTRFRDSQNQILLVPPSTLFGAVLR